MNAKQNEIKFSTRAAAGFVAVGCGLLALTGAALLAGREITPKTLLTPNQARLLAPALSERTITLRNAPGLHTVTSERGGIVHTFLVNEAAPLGKETTIDLCRQKRDGALGNGSLFPVRFFATSEEPAVAKETTILPPPTRSRQPVFFSAAELPGMPALVINGASDSVLLSVVAASSGPANAMKQSTPQRWRLLGGRFVDGPMAANILARTEIRRDGGVAWVLWDERAATGLTVNDASRSKLEQATTANVGGTGGGGATQQATYRYALRSRWVPLLGCDAGAVQLAAFASPADVSAAPASTGNSAAAIASTAAPINCATRTGADGNADCEGDAPEPKMTLTRFSRGLAPETVQMSAGVYSVPKKAPLPREDHELFQASVTHGVIKLSANGTLVVTPEDAVLASRLVGSNAILGDDDRALIKKIHRWASGQEVRGAVARFNAEQRTAAIRILGKPEFVERADNDYAWSTASQGVPLLIGRGLPDELMRFVDTALPGWSSWLRVTQWPAGIDSNTAPVTFALATRPEDGGQTIKVRTVGQLARVLGADILKSEGVCRARPCVQGTDISEHVLRIHGGAASGTTPNAVEITLRASTTVVPRTHAARSDQPIYVKDGQPLWAHEGSRITADRHAPARVHIALADGTPLSQLGRPTPAADELGIAALVGIGPEHLSSIGGALSRLPQSDVNATLTINQAWQRAAKTALECTGQRSGMLTINNSSCVAGRNVEENRRSGVVLLDADTGAIVSAVGAPIERYVGAAQEWLAIDRFHPKNSLLRFTPWQHDGGNRFSPGSTFKVLDALANEQVAKSQQTVNQLMAGVSQSTVGSISASKGLQYSASSACYPDPCNDSRAQVENYRMHRPVDYVNSNGTFGVAEALGFSLNTWFAFMNELSDVAVQRGAVDARVVGLQAWRHLRPVSAMAEQLAFGRALQLDGGLFPRHFAWRSDDVLRSTASRIDPVDDVGDVRRLALGLRMQTTPLQMAVVAAAVATGTITEPHILATVDGRAGKSTQMPLNVRTDRVKSGMSLAISRGTARSAFADKSLDAVRPHIFGKTGTAPHADGIHNNAWFIGWIDAGAIPGENRRLAFAVLVSNTDEGETGGARAATVIADMLRLRMKQGVR